MSAAASLSQAGLPDKMSRGDVQELSGKKYTDDQYNSLCDQEGTISYIYLYILYLCL